MKKKTKTIESAEKAIYLYVATAGIGRMSFGVWVGDEPIDRSDGDDEPTFTTLDEAFSAVGARLERALALAAWQGKPYVFAPPRARRQRDLRVVRVTYTGYEYLAEWLWWTSTAWTVDDDHAARFERAAGKTISCALEELATQTTQELSHAAWVERFR